MESFAISQSEALLLGRCLELYLQEVSDDPRVRFTSHLDNAIQRFLPSNTRQTVVTDQASPPASTDWLGTEVCGIGYSSERPQSVYLSDTTGEEPVAVTFEITRIESKRFLDSLIIDFIRDLLDEKLDRVRNTLPPHEWGLAVYRSYVERFAGESELIGSDHQSEAISDENPAEIERRMTELISANEENKQYESAFRQGRQLGELEALCCRCMADCVEWMVEAMDHPDDPVAETDCLANLHNAANSLGRWKSILPHEFHIEATPIVEAFLKDEEIDLGLRSRQLLESFLYADESWNHTSDGEDNSQCFLDDLLRVQQVQASIWLVLGELIGKSHTEDIETYRRDFESHRPRVAHQLGEFSVSTRSDASKIKGQLELVSRMFSADPSNTATAYTICSSIVNAIEALAYRHWPEEFDAVKEPSTRDILKGHIHKSKTHAEEHFARVAETLHRIYRNEFSHPRNGAVDMSDAVFLVNGVHKLLQLSNEIYANKRKDS